jgi:hypothetical protein
MLVSLALRERSIADVEVIPWNCDDDWGVAVRFDGGSSIMEKVGTKTEADARMLQLLRDPDRLFD